MLSRMMKEEKSKSVLSSDSAKTAPKEAAPAAKEAAPAKAEAAAE